MADEVGLSAPEAAALAWSLGELGCGPVAPPPRFAPTFGRPQQGGLSRRAPFGPFTVEGVARDRGMIVAALRDPKGLAMALKLRLEDDELVVAACGYLPPAGFVLRSADASDDAALSAIERAAPIELVDGSTYETNRPRLGDYHRLQEKTVRAVIEHDGRPVAARVIAVRTLRLGGANVAIGTSQLSRVLPEMRGNNLMRCFDLWMGEEVLPVVDTVLAYTDPGNSAVQASFRVGPAMWRRRVLELTFSCSAIAGPPAGRAASRSDANRVAVLSNSAHARSALYGAMDERSATQRLERARDVYSWADILIATNAMLGVWPSRDETTDRKPGRAPKQRVLSVALDYGFDGSAGPSDLLALLRAQAARLQALGCSHIVLYTYPGSPLEPVLGSLAEDAAEIALQIGLPEPEDAAGVHTDPLYL